MAYNVTVRRDDTERVYYVVSSDIPGLHAESSSADELFAIVRDLAPDLLSAETDDIPIEFHVEVIAAHVV
jgi:hypothetical protein